jgi:hypothetical protein
VRYYPEVYLEGLRKTTINLIQDSRSLGGPRFEPRTSRIQSRRVNHSTTMCGTNLLSSHENLFILICDIVILVQVFILWIHMHFTGTVIRSRRPQISSWRGAVFVRDCTYLSHSLFWMFCTAAEGKIRSADWYIQKVSTEVWISFQRLKEDSNKDLFSVFIWLFNGV